MLKKTTLILALSAAGIIPVFAQNLAFSSDSTFIGKNEIEKNGKPLKEVVIQENRIQLPFARQNRNIRIIDQALIQTLPVHSVNELLSYVAGIDVRQRGPKGSQTDIGLDG